MLPECARLRVVLENEKTRWPCLEKKGGPSHPNTSKRDVFLEKTPRADHLVTYTKGFR